MKIDFYDLEALVKKDGSSSGGNSSGDQGGSGSGEGGLDENPLHNAHILVFGLDHPLFVAIGGVALLGGDEPGGDLGPGGSGGLEPELRRVL